MPLLCLVSALSVYTAVPDSILFVLVWDQLAFIASLPHSLLLTVGLSYLQVWI